MHGFDEWFGNLYHLNAEEEPEELDYPGQKNPEYLKKYRSARRAACLGDRQGRCDGRPEIRPRGQAEDRGHRPADAQAHGDLRCARCSSTRSSGSTARPRATSRSSAGSTPPPSTSGRTRRKKYIQMAVDEGRGEEDVVRAKMIEHDEQVGALLKKLEDLGVADNTIVIYTHRQRQRADDVAGRRLRAVPRREGHAPGKAACACRC